MSELKILIPLDGSKPAELALRFLTALKPLGALSVRLVSVREGNEGESPEDRARGREAVKRYIESVADRVQHDFQLPVEHSIDSGIPYAQIIAETVKPDVDLLLMTTHGISSFDPERLGSVTDKVVRGAFCPTLLIGPHASVPLQVERITVPLDGSELASEALPVARAFAEKLNARLRLVRAIESLSTLEADSIGGLAADVVGSLEITARLYLEEAKLELGTRQPVETEVLTGPPAPTLLFDLKQNRPDLVIMTSHGRHGFIRWALGSVTDRIIRGSVPVLVLRPADSQSNKLATLLASEPAKA
ncbi:MAG TPA: universal stress protein [Dehalococcoidia bacterium]|nr:universal stress protein [Dehalococcoidia bacterium]